MNQRLVDIMEPSQNFVLSCVVVERFNNFTKHLNKSPIVTTQAQKTSYYLLNSNLVANVSSDVTKEIDLLLAGDIVLVI